MRIRWVKVWVDAMATLTERFRDYEGRIDFEALGREEYAFRHALVTGDFSRSERARDLYEATLSEITARSEAGRKSAEARRNKKNTAAASTSDGEDESTTVSEPLPSNPLTEPPRSGAKSGKNLTGADYDQETTETQAAPSPLLEVSEKSSGEGAVTVPAKVQKKTPHGEFKNVMLTTAEVNSLCEKLGVSRAKELVEELSQYMASKGKKYKSHYATILAWDRKKNDEQAPRQKFMTSDDISRRNYEQGVREIMEIENRRKMIGGQAV